MPHAVFWVCCDPYCSPLSFFFAVKLYGYVNDYTMVAVAPFLGSRVAVSESLTVIIARLVCGVNFFD